MGARRGHYACHWPGCGRIFGTNTGLSVHETWHSKEGADVVGRGMVDDSYTQREIEIAERLLQSRRNQKKGQRALRVQKTLALRFIRELEEVGFEIVSIHPSQHALNS